jgi:WD40 repeat protein
MIVPRPIEHPLLSNAVNGCCRAKFCLRMQIEQSGSFFRNGQLLSCDTCCRSDGRFHGVCTEMTNYKINRRHCLIATSSLITAILGARPGLANETVAAPLSRTIDPLDDGHHPPVIKAMALDPRGLYLAVAGDDCSIRILDTNDLTEKERLNGHRDLVRTLAFRPDGRLLASAGNDGRLILWDRANRWSIARQIDDLPTIFDVRFAPQGNQLAAVGFDTQLMLFDNTQRPSLHCDCADLRAVTYNATGDRLAVVGRSGKLHLFNPQSGQEVGEFTIHASRVRDIVFLPGTNQAVTVGEDGAATVFDLENYQVTRKINFLPCKLFTVTAIDKSTVAVAGSDNRIRLVNVATGEVTGHIDVHIGSINALVYADGMLYSGGFDARIVKTRVAGGQDPRIAERDKSTGR